MKEHGILFSAPMVRALLAGTKTQTRRIAKAPKGYETSGISPDSRVPQLVTRLVDEKADDHRSPVRYVSAPHGPVGRRLWVRETHCPQYFGDAHPTEREGCGYRAEFDAANLAGIVKAPRWTPAIHMRRELSRITLEVSRVRLERVQAITEDDARAEGVEKGMTGAETIERAAGLPRASSFRSGYAVLWDAINGAGSWTSNPWCWVYDFKRTP